MAKCETPEQTDSSKSSCTIDSYSNEFHCPYGSGATLKAPTAIIPAGNARTQSAEEHYRGGRHLEQVLEDTMLNDSVDRWTQDRARHT